MRITWRLALASAVLLSGQAWAQPSGFFIGATIERSEMTSPTGLVVLSDPPMVQRAQERDDGYKAFLGYRFNEYFRLEVSGADYGATDPVVVGQQPSGENLLVRMDNQALQLSALGILPLADGAVDFFGRIGVSYVKEKLRLIEVPLIINPLQQVTLGTTTEKSIRPTFGFGVQFNLGTERQFGVRLEWETIQGDVFERTDFYGAGIKYRF